jgi:hypothetical protein
MDYTLLFTFIFIFALVKKLKPQNSFSVDAHHVFARESPEGRNVEDSGSPIRHG